MTERAGAKLDGARAAAIMVHGRGASAQSILTLAQHFGQADIAYLAPQAPGNTWYPFSFLAPLEQNEPSLTAALETLAGVMDEIGKAGIAPEKTALIGFSQGGCLALEFAARNARRYGALIGLSAGLIGPRDTPRDYAGSLDGTPVFLGSSDIDSHVPLWRVQETTAVLRALGGFVTERIYPGMAHTIVDDEVVVARRLLAAI